jgi:hypothetical protein
LGHAGHSQGRHQRQRHQELFLHCKSSEIEERQRRQFSRSEPSSRDGWIGSELTTGTCAPITWDKARLCWHLQFNGQSFSGSRIL